VPTLFCRCSQVGCYFTFFSFGVSFTAFVVVRSGLYTAELTTSRWGAHTRLAHTHTPTIRFMGMGTSASVRRNGGRLSACSADTVLGQRLGVGRNLTPALTLAPTLALTLAYGRTGRRRHAAGGERAPGDRRRAEGGGRQGAAGAAGHVGGLSTSACQGERALSCALLP